MVMKKYYAFLLIMVSSFFPAVMPSTAFAQDEGQGSSHQPPSADEIVSKMQSKLNLTQDQVTAITPIVTKYTSQFEELRQQVEDGTLERSDMRSKMKDLRESEKQELGQILSADQLSQWEQMQKSWHKHSSGSGDGNSNGANAQGLTGSGQ